MRSLVRMPLICVIMAQVAFSPFAQGVDKAQACKQYVEACNAVIEEQDVAIKNLKAGVSKLETSLKDAQNTPTSQVILLVIAAGLAGMLISNTLHK